MSNQLLIANNMVKFNEALHIMEAIIKDQIEFKAHLSELVERIKTPIEDAIEEKQKMSIVRAKIKKAFNN